MGALGLGLLSWLGFDLLVILLLWLHAYMNETRRRLIRRRRWRRWATQRNRWITLPTR